LFLFYSCSFFIFVLFKQTNNNKRLSRYSNTANSRMHSEVGTIYYVAPEVLFGVR
jgi:serine/threonine protein kinase